MSFPDEQRNRLSILRRFAKTVGVPVVELVK
jgi:hypothetical protein